MKITSPTPRTDKAIVELDMQDLSIGHKLRETQNLARLREHELNELQADSYQVKQALAYCVCVIETNLEMKDDIKFKWAKRLAAMPNIRS